MNHEIIRYDSIYIDQICELEKEIWSPDLNVNKSYLQWKYFDNPFPDSPKLYLAIEGGQIIAVRGMFGTKWQLGIGDRFTALCAGDSIIHPKYRNKGIYAEILNFINNDSYKLGYEYLFSFSAGTTTLINNLANGWKSIGRIRTMSKVYYPRTKARKLMRAHKVKKLIKFINNTTAASLLIRRVNTLNFNKLLNHRMKIPHIRIEKNPIPDEMAVLVGKLAIENKIVLSRDEKFFRWRYNNPLSKYIFLYWYDKELKGYLIAQTSLYKIESINTYSIIELEGVNSAIRIDLLKSAISLLASRSIITWSNMLDENCRKFLSSNGFNESNSIDSVGEYTPTVLVTMTNGPTYKIEYRGTNLLDINNWDLKMMYSDAL